ncbi:rod shape-determining protein MreD [Streptococcus dentasini]
MNWFKNKISISLFAFLLMLIDGHLSDIFSTLTGRSIILQVHFLLIFLFFVQRYINNAYFSYSLAFILGLIYDSYNLNFIGVAFFILPLVVYIIRKWGRYFVTGLRRAQAFFILITLFETGCYGLAYLYHLTTYDFLSFVTYQLVVSLLLNSLIFIIIDKIMRRNGFK